ncbi:MAG: hypothetical protein R3C70_09890 [Geminicoccaceae bacterium]
MPAHVRRIRFGTPDIAREARIAPACLPGENILKRLMPDLHLPLIGWIAGRRADVAGVAFRMTMMQSREKQHECQNGPPEKLHPGSPL